MDTVNVHIYNVLYMYNVCLYMCKVCLYMFMHNLLLLNVSIYNKLICCFFASKFIYMLCECKCVMQCRRI